MFKLSSNTEYQKDINIILWLRICIKILRNLAHLKIISCFIISQQIRIIF